MSTSRGSQGQLICTGCRTLLVYPHGANNVRCALCSSVTAVPRHGTEMAHLICGGCQTMLMYSRGASSVQCSCCHTVNPAVEGNQVAQVNCGGCGMTLVYAQGAQSVQCALCKFVTRITLAAPRPSQALTVVVENPMTLDESGKLVSSFSVGVVKDRT